MVPCLDMVVPSWMWCPWARAQLSIWFIRPCHLDGAFAICWPSIRILIYVSMFLVISLRTQANERCSLYELLISLLAHRCWPLQGLSIIPSTWSALAETYLHTYQRHFGLGSSSHWLLATREPEREAAGKLAFHFRSDTCFFCPLKVWMKSGAVHSSESTKDSRKTATHLSSCFHSGHSIKVLLLLFLFLCF